jgi:hypothetical protein
MYPKHLLKGVDQGDRGETLDMSLKRGFFPSINA